jgi:hypothetical protein
MLVIPRPINENKINENNKITINLFFFNFFNILVLISHTSILYKYY